MCFCVCEKRKRRGREEGERVQEEKSRQKQGRGDGSLTSSVYEIWPYRMTSVLKAQAHDVTMMFLALCPCGSRDE